MDCPHCGEETLMGAKTCLSCGKSLFSRPTGGKGGADLPRSGASRAMDIPGQSDTHLGRRRSDPSDASESFASSGVGSEAPPQSTPNSSARDPSTPSSSASGPPALPTSQGPALCKLCLGPCEPGAENRICASCRGLKSEMSEGNLGQNDEYIHPNNSNESSFLDRMGSKDLRPTQRGERRVSLRRGPVAALIGLVLALVAGAVVVLDGEPNPVDVHLQGVKPIQSELTHAVPRDQLVEIDTDYRLRIHREAILGGFTSKMETVVDLSQHSVQSAQMMFVRDESNGSVVDLSTECRVAMQDGKARSGDAREVAAYPWVGHIAKWRVLVPKKGTPSVLGGAGLPAGSDITPFLTLGTTRAPSAAVLANESWTSPQALALVADGNGALTAHLYECTFTYRGRKVVAAHDCVAVHVLGKPLRDLPERLERYNRIGGGFEGALYFDVATGLIVEGDLYTDVNVRIESGRVDERAGTSGHVRISRR